MGNKKAREFMKKQAVEKAWEHVENNPRNLYDLVVLPGIGIERIQILYSPSFEESKWWEVRQLESEWRLYASNVSFDYKRLSHTLIGYKRIPIKSEILHDFFKKACEIQVPIKPYLKDNWSGQDGTTIEFSIIGDLFSLLRFRWWTTYPKQWSELVDLAKQMIRKFRSLEQSVVILTQFLFLDILCFSNKGQRWLSNAPSVISSIHLLQLMTSMSSTQ